MAKEICDIEDNFYNSGEHEIIWQPRNLPMGLYIMRINSAEYSYNKLIFLLK